MFLVIVLLLSGCIQAPSGSMVAKDLEALQNPAFTDCIWTSTAMAWPLDLGPGSSPEGWTFEGGSSGLSYLFLDCKRTSWGPFERGPVQFLFELVAKGGPPEPCQATGYAPLVFHSLVVSDSEISNWTSSYLNIPSYTFDHISLAEQNSLGEINIEWTIMGFPGENHLSLNQMQIGDEVSIKSHGRWFWESEEGISFLQVDSETNRSQIDVLGAGFGEMSQPMLYAETGNPWTGNAVIINNPQITAQLRTFEGQTCEE